MIDLKKLRKYKGRKAVSPVVATLILIIVAIVGAVAVGLIVSGIGSQTSKQANGGQAAGASSTQILVGGSTVMYPALVAGATSFDAAHPGIAVNVTNGGSGAGLEGVALGVIDIAASSSYGQTASAISSYPSANLQPQEVGGSATVVIVNGGNGAFLTDTANACIGITQGALKAIATDGTFSIAATSCAANGLLQAAGVTAGNTYTFVSRSDLPAGVEDSFYDYVYNSTSGSITAPGWGGVTAAGDAGVISYVESHTGTIGITDLGAVEATFGGNIVSGVSVVSIYTGSNGVGPTALSSCSTDAITAAAAPYAYAHPATPATGSTFATGGDCAALTGTSSADLHNYVKNSLNTAPSAISSTNQVYPDAVSANGPVTGLSRTFWLVTAGTPTADESAFITFVASPANIGFWHNAGLFSIYDFTPITPP